MTIITDPVRERSDRTNMQQWKGCSRSASMLAAALLLHLAAAAQETVNEYETWTQWKFSTRIGRKIKIHVEPELRLRNDFFIDKYMIEAGARYEVLDFAELGASYRFIGNRRREKETEYLHRYALDATFGKRIMRFRPEARIRYTNFTDDDLDANYLRYKLELEYDIPACRITPFVFAQAFHKLSVNRLSKMRYAAGAEYQFIQNNYIGLFYKFDYYMLEYRNKHILGITYRLKL